MKLKDLIPMIQGTVAIYKRCTDDGEVGFKDLYRGEKYEIPEELLEKEVEIIAGTRKSTLDIQVEASDEQA